MAGIYIHIPFCRKKCHYCNFYSVASPKHRHKFIDTLSEEIFLRKNYLHGKEIRTIYFGGGTPSFLESGGIVKILDVLHNYFSFSSVQEITLEANPDDLNPSVLKDYREAGINRLSIGIQSFFDEDLRYLNRVHSASRASEAIHEARDAGFENLSIDLIFGIPTLSNENWEKNLDAAFVLEIPHISAYSLTVEPGTALDVLIRKGKTTAPEEESSNTHFRILMTMMKQHGYEHYEISNFSKPGRYSLHNSQYWNGEHYLGLGPSAHSYNGHSRQWNIASIIEYADQIRNGGSFFEKEELTPAQQYDEYVMVSLRTMWGCDTGVIRERFGENLVDYFSSRALKYISEGKMQENRGIYTLTDEGKLFADGIASDLFLADARG
jgi:oxygen-independent coproporphyrinogen III oxidase